MMTLCSYIARVVWCGVVWCGLCWQLVSGILAIPKAFRLMFFGWLKCFPSEYFSRIIFVMQGFLSFILSNRAANLDPTPVVLVLDR
jgi:hypothetical protein